VVIDIREISTESDYFLVCSADNMVQVKAVCDRIRRALQEENVKANHVEGYGASGWVLIDFGSVVVHVFLEPLRRYYALEDLWGDARRIDFTARS